MVSTSGVSPLNDAREELLREASIEAEASGREKAREESGPARSLLVFFLGAEGFAVDLAHVRKVLRPARIARVSGAAPEVLGLMNCQGEVLCVLDLRRILSPGKETAPPAATEEKFIVVIQSRREGSGISGRRGPGRGGTSGLLRPPGARFDRSVPGPPLRGDGGVRRAVRRPAVAVGVPEPVTTGSVDLLVVDDGAGFRGYDCRDVVRVEEVEGEPGGYLVRLGRLGSPREVACREILGSVALSAREIRPVPEVLRERITGEKPWAVGITEREMYLLY